MRPVDAEWLPMPDLLVFIVVSAALGALIGLIRQWDEQKGERPGDFAGVRTHTFWAVLGCLAAFASEAHTPFVFVAVVLAVTGHLIAQGLNPAEKSPPGSTTLASAMLTLFCGALVFWEETKSAILAAAMTMVLQGIKRPLHTWTRHINSEDIRATLQFAAVSGVILPLVPNRDMGPFDGFNPFSTWLMVVLISGLSFAGYLAIRIVGPGAGILLTGVLGGLASSTASTLAFSRRSREEPGMSEHYSLAVVAACTVMLPRVLVATGFVNRNFTLGLIVPLAVLALPGIVYAAWVLLLHRPKTKEGDTPPLGNPLSLSTAIKFAALYAIIAFLVKALREQGWSQALLPLSFLSGLTDMIAISLSLARDQLDGQAASLATKAVVLAAVSNTLLKTGMAVALGSPGLKWRVGIVLGATALIGVGWMFFGPEWHPFARAAAE
jgi:uncharacterized membrane protein (DUF4010 family)